MTGWRDRASCRAVDPDLFYPSVPRDLERARAVCRACPVRLDCARDVLEAGDGWGVSGGLAPAERDVLPRGLGDEDLAGALARIDAALDAPGRSRSPLVDCLVDVLASAFTSAADAAFPPDPQAAEHRAVLLRELDAYAAAHRGGRPSAHRHAAPLTQQARAA